MIGIQGGFAMNHNLLFSSEQDVRFGKVLRFILPTYLTSLFNTLYTIVDGIFVSQYVGTNALAAINIVYPIVNILTGIALVFATGGSAKAAISIGADNLDRAGQEFTLSALFSLVIGIVASIVMFLFLPQILLFLGATEPTMPDCKVYAVIWLIGVPVVIGKEFFTYFVRADGSPGYSFFLAVSGGVANIVLDYLLIARFGMGVLGAGLATILGLAISFALGIIYFLRFKKNLHLVRKHLNVTIGLKCAINGSSEFVDQLAIAITTVVFNRTALSFAGENGIAAVSIIMYLQFLFIGVYFGYSMGIAPLLSYSYGNSCYAICRKLEDYSYRFFVMAPPIMYALAFFFAPFMVSFFTQPETDVFSLALSGMRLYGIGYLFTGFNIFTAIRLTAYGKGHLSAVITSLRSFALLILFLYLLPMVWGMTGLWLAMPAAELLTLLVSFYLSSKVSLDK
jgi:Na+-driven multidrug efflux pump